MSDRAYSLDDQCGWYELPAQEELDEPGPDVAETPPQSAPAAVADDGDAMADLDCMPSTSAGASIPPWSAAHPYVNLYTHKNPVTATVVGNYQIGRAHV